jgi:hypothetical protein
MNMATRRNFLHLRYIQLRRRFARRRMARDLGWKSGWQATG